MVSNRKMSNMANSKLVSFEVSHFYPNLKPQKFWDFFVDHEWYSQSDIMQGENHPKAKNIVKQPIRKQ